MTARSISYPGFSTRSLEPNHAVCIGRLSQDLILDEKPFLRLWATRPDVFHEVTIHGRTVPTPRWQQAYGCSYRYTGSSNTARPITPLLAPFLAWSQQQIDARLNGLLLNWYDGSLGHYIGKHRDSTTGLVPSAPIVTISLGETRTFRLRPWKEKGFVDLELEHGDVIVIPAQTNTAYTHEVPRKRRYQGKRISITIRAFEKDRDSPGSAGS